MTKRDTKVIIPFRDLKDGSLDDSIILATCVAIYFKRETGFYYDLKQNKAISSILLGQEHVIDNVRIKMHIKNLQNIGFFHTHTADTEPSLIDFSFSDFSELLIMNCESLQMIRIHKDIFKSQKFLTCFFLYCDKFQQYNELVERNQAVGKMGDKIATHLSKKNIQRIEREIHSLYSEALKAKAKDEQCWACLVKRFRLDWGYFEQKQLQNVYETLKDTFTKLEEKI